MDGKSVSRKLQALVFIRFTTHATSIWGGMMRGGGGGGRITLSCGHNCFSMTCVIRNLLWPVTWIAQISPNSWFWKLSRASSGKNLEGRPTQQFVSRGRFIQPPFWVSSRPPVRVSHQKSPWFPGVFSPPHTQNIKYPPPKKGRRLRRYCGNLKYHRSK